MIEERPEWMSRARCRALPTELFYPGQGECPEGAALCLGCPVRGECLTYALVHREVHGTWGGLSERKRRPLRALMMRERRNGEPFEVEVHSDGLVLTLNSAPLDGHYERRAG